MNKKQTLTVGLFLLVTHSILPAQAKTYNLEEKSNPTEAVLTTIFLGDVDRSGAFVKVLAQHYESFLTGFVHDEFCTEGEGGDHVLEACMEIKRTEEEQIKNGGWTKNFHLAATNFRQHNGNNIGIYNFVKAANISQKYQCDITMQLTAILSRQPLKVLREFFVNCD